MPLSRNERDGSDILTLVQDMFSHAMTHLMRIAFVSVRFRGHVTVLLEQWNAQPNSHLFLLAFKNDTGFEMGHAQGRVTEIIANRASPSEVAAVFNKARCDLLCDELHVRMYDYRPDVIVYDFFCLEAHIVARRLGVPAICSVPATLHATRSDVCSDARLLDEKLYWVWRHPVPHPIRPANRVVFLGPRCQGVGAIPIVPPGRFFIYVTLGTVIPHYESFTSKRETFVQALLYSATDDVFVVASIPGHSGRSTHNVVFVDDCDQVAVLRDLKPHLFIFHGGGNSYSEALAHGIPCLVYPFFGDQFETARHCSELCDVSELVQYVRREKLARVPDKSGLPLRVPFDDTFADYFESGDLVFGHSRHRNALQAQCPSVNLHLNHFCSFAHICAGDELPAVADVYNDEPLDSTIDESSQPRYALRLNAFRFYKQQRDKKLSHVALHEHKLVHYCLLLAELTITMWSGRVHFLLDNEGEMGPATRIELDFVLGKVKSSAVWRSNVIFYRFGRRVPAPMDWPVKVRGGKAEPAVNHHYVPPFQLHGRGRMPFWSARQKARFSLKEKSDVRKIPVHDHMAFRTGYLNAPDLAELLTRANDQYDVRVNEGRIVYLYYRHDATWTEVQLWPWVYLHHFYLNMAGIETDRAKQEAMQDAIDRPPFVDMECENVNDLL